MPLRICPADPAGNLTLFVLDQVLAPQRASLAAALMRQDPAVEQVAFAVPPRMGGDGRIEMMGGEFCGNACRAYGLLLARQRGGMPARLLVEVSGAPAPVPVEADPGARRSSAAMPLPRRLFAREVGGVSGVLAEFDGISHLVLPVSFDPALLRQGQALLEATGADAWGVLFLDGLSMTPVVTVRSTGTTVFEGSCGSGSVAAACALSLGKADGWHRFALRQPRGTIEAAVRLDGGRAMEGSIGGAVSVGAVCIAGEKAPLEKSFFDLSNFS